MKPASEAMREQMKETRGKLLMARRRRGDLERLAQYRYGQTADDIPDTPDGNAMLRELYLANMWVEAFERELAFLHAPSEGRA